VIAAVLTGAMLLLGVSLVGSPWQYTLIVFMVIVASLGLGFVLSSFAQTDSQAVQYTMTILLASIFFTGLVLPLDQVIPPVRVISYLLPATFGIGAMHDVMFRGLAPDDLLLWGLAAYGVVMFAGSWYVMRRHVRSEI
jgi:ABC-2 type transport system permease protein